MTPPDPELHASDDLIAALREATANPNRHLLASKAEIRAVLNRLEKAEAERDDLKAAADYLGNQIRDRCDIIAALAAERDELKHELSTWRSVFPDIAPERVLPDRSKLEAERDRLAGLVADVERVRHDALDEATTFGICTAPTIHDINGRRYEVAVKLRADFHCKVCGSSTLIAPDWPERGVCPDHCEDHDYEYDQGERRRFCKSCGQEPPFNYYDDLG